MTDVVMLDYSFLDDDGSRTVSSSSSFSSGRTVVAEVRYPSLSNVHILSNPALLPSVLGLKLPLLPTSSRSSSSAGELKSCISQSSSEVGGTPCTIPVSKSTNDPFICHAATVAAEFALDRDSFAYPCPLDTDS